MAKTCYKCLITKDDTEFYATHGNMCKVCAKAVIAENRRVRMQDPMLHAERMAYNAAWWKDHPEQLQAKNKRRHARHSVRRNKNRHQRKRSLKTTNPLAYAAQNSTEYHARMARLLQANINDLSPAQRPEIILAYGSRCVYCDKQFPAHLLTIDHITALANQGDNTLWNLVPACNTCNARKGTGPAPKMVQPLLLTVAPPKKKPA